MTFNLVEQVTRGRKSPGVDWQCSIVVLARYGPKELWWEGSKRWRSEYFPAELILVDDGERRWSSCTYGHKTLHEGGRLSAKLLAAHAATIDEFFGCPVAEKLDPKKTLLIEE